MKPAAWINPKELEDFVSTSVSKHQCFSDDVPLYLAPKPLSDEEIKVIATQNRADLTIPAYISFARLIEERHGIK